MDRYIVSKVESFIADDVKYEVTDSQYPKGLGGPKVIATFIDGADAYNFVNQKIEIGKKFTAGVKAANERYGDAMKKLAEHD